jgi:Ca-activated chloride channel family protein
MFTINAYNNPYLRVGQTTFQAVLSVSLDQNVALSPAPLSLAVALDRSASMDGSKMGAARNGAIKVVQAIDASMIFMVVAFNDSARVLFGPAPGTEENKRKAIIAIQTVNAANGTRMSLALNTIVDKFGQDQTRATKVLFLTDGKNEGELSIALDRAVDRCRAANIGIHAWGVGTDWDAAELRHMADATHGSADIIPTPNQVAAAFASSFSEMRKTAIANARLSLWTPQGVTIHSIAQVFPSIAQLGMEPDAANPRQQGVSLLQYPTADRRSGEKPQPPFAPPSIDNSTGMMPKMSSVVSLGSFAAGDQHDYLLELEVSPYPPGQQFMILRPSVRFIADGTQEIEEKAARTGWVFVQWTEDTALAAQIEAHIAHYTNQEELSRIIKEGQEALALGDKAKATRLLGEALAISERTGNEKVTRLLSSIVQRDANGTIRLNQQADAVAKKTLAINVGRTTRLNG